MTLDRRLALALVLFFQGAYLLVAAARPRMVDEYALHFMTESLYRDGTTAVPQLVQMGQFYGRRSPDGRPYTPWGPGQPLLAAR